MATSDNGLLHLMPVPCATSREVLTERPVLTVDSLATSVVYLGDNDTTGIVDPALSPNVVKLYEKRGKLFAFCCRDGRGLVTLNGMSLPKGGRRELRDGDVLVLMSENADDGAYFYRVGQPPDDDDNAAAAVVEDSQEGTAAVAPLSHTNTAPAAAAAPAGQPFPPQVSEDTMCAICMEIMVEPQTIVPCGHSFCKGCLQTQTECAECRGPLHGQVTCRSLQNLIGDLVEVATTQPHLAIFDKEDLESYHGRKAQATRASSSTTTRAATTTLQSAARKRRRAMRRNLAAVGHSANNVIDLG